MAAPSIGGTALTINANHSKCGGSYHFHRAPSRYAGSGAHYLGGEQWAEWTWKALSITDFNTLRTRWQSNPTAFELWSDDEKATAVSFTSGAMFEPVHGECVNNSYFADVKIEFHGLIPLQA